MDDLDAILNFTPIDSRLASSGQPGPDQFTLLARSGFTAALNLATPASTGHLPEEPDLCRKAGLDFAWMPVAWDNPLPADFEAFRAWLDANRTRKVLVHCAKNWRASLFCALYRMTREGLDPEAAREAVLEVWQPDGVWSAFAEKVLAGHGLAPLRF